MVTQNGNPHVRHVTHFNERAAYAGRERCTVLCDRSLLGCQQSTCAGFWPTWVLNCVLEKREFKHMHTPMMHFFPWLWGWHHGRMHVVKSTKLFTLARFMTSSLPSICLLMQNPSKLDFLTVQPFLSWQVPFSSCSFSCWVVSKPQPRELLPRCLAKAFTNVCFNLF